jgi:hypothetical protein
MSDDQKDYNWLQSIIDSCNNTFHFACVDRMIELYAEKHHNANLIMCLIQQRAVHYNNVHGILS